MRVFSPPSGYLSLYEASNELMRKMHEGMSPSNVVVQYQYDKTHYDEIHVWNSTWKMRAKRALYEAILSKDVDLYAELFSAGPRKLSPDIVHACMRFQGQGLPTLAYIDRHVMAPFDLPWSLVKELRQAVILIDTQAFRDWLNKESRKKAWPCQSSEVSPKRGRGRPRDLRDGVIEVLENLIENKNLTSSMVRKQIHEKVIKANPSLANVSSDTVDRACQEIGFEFASSRSSHR